MATLLAPTRVCPRKINTSTSFEDKSIDLLHIDGLQTYDAVKQDFTTWLPKMTNDGVVLFHDTNERRDDFGMYKFWDEVSKDHQTINFLHRHGLGVLFLSKSTNSILPIRETDRQVFNSTFEILGSQVGVQLDRDAAIKSRDAKKQELDAILSSASWRITKPLRDIYGWVASLF